MRYCSAEMTDTPAPSTNRLTPSHSEKPRCEGDNGWLLTMRRNSPNRSTTKPKPIRAMAVRCQASSVQLCCEQHARIVEVGHRGTSSVSQTIQGRNLVVRIL